VSREVLCGSHGRRRAAFACHHLVSGLTDRAPRGVNWLRDDAGQVNAWCDACDDHLVANGNDWNDVTEGFAQVTLICQECFGQFSTFDTMKDRT
jgi:hypothetical protein